MFFDNDNLSYVIAEGLLLFVRNYSSHLRSAVKMFLSVVLWFKLIFLWSHHISSPNMVQKKDDDEFKEKVKFK